MKKEKAQSIWASLWEQYKMEWKKLWDEYKTVIGPFIKGTFAYIWKIISGILSGITVGLYETGRIILNWLLKIIEKA